jgi:hypothetical protein
MVVRYATMARSLLHYPPSSLFGNMPMNSPWNSTTTAPCIDPVCHRLRRPRAANHTQSWKAVWKSESRSRAHSHGCNFVPAHVAAGDPRLAAGWNRTRRRRHSRVGADRRHGCNACDDHRLAPRQRPGPGCRRRWRHLRYRAGRRQRRDHRATDRRHRRRRDRARQHGTIRCWRRRRCCRRICGRPRWCSLLQSFWRWISRRQSRRQRTGWQRPFWLQQWQRQRRRWRRGRQQR